MTPKSLIKALNLQSLLRTRLSFLSFSLSLIIPKRVTCIRWWRWVTCIADSISFSLHIYVKLLAGHDQQRRIYTRPSNESNDTRTKSLSSQYLTRQRWWWQLGAASFSLFSFVYFLFFFLSSSQRIHASPETRLPNNQSVIVERRADTTKKERRNCNSSSRESLCQTGASWWWEEVDYNFPYSCTHVTKGNISWAPASV